MRAHCERPITPASLAALYEIRLRRSRERRRAAASDLPIDEHVPHRAKEADLFCFQNSIPFAKNESESR